MRAICVTCILSFFLDFKDTWGVFEKPTRAALIARTPPTVAFEAISPTLANTTTCFLQVIATLPEPVSHWEAAVSERSRLLLRER